MRLERKMVNIMDHENKEVVERFPVHLVREPTAFTSNDPKVKFSFQVMELLKVCHFDANRLKIRKFGNEPFVYANFTSEFGTRF